MRKLIFALIWGAAAFGVCVGLFEVASAGAAQPAKVSTPAQPAAQRSAVRFSTTSSVPVVVTTSTPAARVPGVAPAVAKVTASGAVVVPMGTPSALDRGSPQVSSLPAIVYLPHGRMPQNLPPGVIAQSAQIQRFSDRRFRFSFLNNSVIPNQSIPRPITP